MNKTDKEKWLSGSNPYMCTSIGGTTLGCSNTFTVTSANMWFQPKRINVVEKSDCVEFIYKETSMITLTIYPTPPPEERVFKIVFSCKDGKFHKSERIYGEIIPSQEEYYEFND